jgi:sugar phosphate isomerase/epimerase
MKVHLSYAAGFYTKTFEEFIRHAGKLGVCGVQLIPDQDPNLYSQFSSGRSSSLVKYLSDHKMIATMHNVFYDINLCSLLPAVRDFSLSVTEEVLELCKALHVSQLVIHPGYIYPGWKNDYKQNLRFWDAAQGSILKLAKRCEKSGVVPLFENGSYTLSSRKSTSKQDFHLGISVEELGRLLDFTGTIGKVCLDIGKVRASEQSIGDFFDRLGDRIIQAQVSTLDDLLELRQYVQEEKLTDLVLVFEGKSESELQKVLQFGLDN